MRLVSYYKDVTVHNEAVRDLVESKFRDIAILQLVFF